MEIGQPRGGRSIIAKTQISQRKKSHHNCKNSTSREITFSLQKYPANKIRALEWPTWPTTLLTVTVKI